MCICSRNLLHSEPTYQASTRIYAVTRLDMEPPSPPGWQKEEKKHFSILQDPAPPPPPHPPPSPPHKPPPPLPAALGTHTETHIECEFAEGMDASVVGPAGASTDTTADTMRHCCSKCGMQAGCTDFVYEPASKTCVLMPSVPSYRLKRSPNNSTIAGSVSISHIDQTHAACHFDVGSGYAGGAIGAGKALPGKTMGSKQDCCDACEREPHCAKFVFEHYGGDCQLFGPQAEQYFTFNLLSGTVDSRASPDTHTMANGDNEGHQDVDSILDEMDHWQDDSINDDILPPIPPMFSFSSTSPAPAPPGAEAGAAEEFLADFSLGIGFLILVTFSVFMYLFFAQDIGSFLYTYSGGKFGKRPKSLLLPTAEPNELSAAGPKKKKNALPPGWAKLTVQTSQVTQKKEVEVAACETLADLIDLVWDEFGHLLKKTKRKDMVLLVWDDGGTAGTAAEADGTGRWAQVTNSSDMAQVAACTSMKLAEKQALDLDALAVAFSSALTDETHRRRGGKHGSPRLALQQSAGGGKDGLDSCSDESDEETSPPAARGSKAGRAKTRGPTRACASRRKGGFEALDTVDADDSGSDGDNELDAPLCGSSGTPRGASKARGVVNGRRAGRNDKDFAPTSCRSGRAGNRRDVDRTRPRRSSQGAANSDDEMELALTTGKGLVGRRVEIYGLSSRRSLNGRRGVASSYDQDKGRYRVRLDAGDHEESQVLAFMPSNVRLVQAVN